MHLEGRVGKMGERKVHTEEFQISGDLLLAKIKELVREGNIERGLNRHLVPLEEVLSHVFMSGP